jgi:hypothetical protein
MEIYFDHSGKECKAHVIYNFKEVADSILIVFNGGLGTNLMLYKQNNVWVSDSKLQEKHPETYLNIQKAIIEVFKKDGMLYDLHLQEYLS